VTAGDSQPEAAEIEASLQRFLAEVLRLRIAPVELGLELVSGGHLDSMDLVRVASHLERLLGIEIPDDDVDDEHLGSLARMLAYVEARR
jgi:acyl carrier protein